MTNPKWLKVAAQRSVRHTWSLGYVFARYQKYEGKSAEDLTAELGCSREVFDWLSVCRRPAEERFAEHLRLLETRFSVEPRRLAAVLRRVEVLDVLPPDEEGMEEGLEESPLLAARDHPDDDEPET